MAGPGVIVATPRGHREGRLHLLVDTAARRTIFRETPELVGHPISYEGGVVYGTTETRDRVLRIDLTTGARISSAPFVFRKGVGTWRVVGFPLAFALAPANLRPLRSNENPREAWSMDVLNLDPVSLAPKERVSVPTSVPNFVGNGLVVFANPEVHPDAAESPVVVLEQSSGREVRRVNVPLHKERIAGVAAANDSLVVTIAGGNRELSGSRQEREGNPWLRVDSYPLGQSGTPWSYKAEGWMGGNPVIEGDAISFAGYERCSGTEPEGMADSRQGFRSRDGFPLKRFSLDRATGRRLGEEPLQLMDKGRRVQPADKYLFFPGRRQAYPDNDISVELIHRDYWFYVADKAPVEVRIGCSEQDCKLIGGPLEERATIAWKDLVFESIPGGAIVVKDFAAGKGMDPVSSGIVSDGVFRRTY